MTDPSLHHVGITVSDLDRATNFYTDTFDLTVAAEFTVDGEAFAEAVDVAGASAAFAHLDGNRTRVELVEYNPQGAALPERTLNRPGAVHIGLAVDDVEAFYADLDDAVETLSPPRTTESGTTICFVCDPDGNRIEVLDA